MKYSTSKIIAVAILASACVPLFAVAAGGPGIVQENVVRTPTDFTVNYKMTVAPPQNMKVYASIQDASAGVWIKRDLYLTEIHPSDSLPVTFDVDYNFTNLGLQPNKVYTYWLATEEQEPLLYIFGPKCFTTTGAIICSGTPTPPPAATPTTPPPSTVTPTSSQTVINQATPPTTASTYQAPPETFGGISVAFPRESQVITETSAEIHGIVSALIIIPVDLSFVSGVSGSPLGNAQSLFNTTLYPGQTHPITMKFTGLSAGTSYYFVLKNTATGTMSHAIYFTTPGGTTNETASFAGQRLGGNDAPPSVVFTDTISDKGIVPRCGRTTDPNVPLEETRMCGYKDFLQLISNIINYAIIILGPIIAVIIMHTGVMIIIEGKKGDPTGAAMEQLKKYQARLGKIAISVLVMALAWTFIATILKELGVKPNYILLDLFSGK